MARLEKVTSADLVVKLKGEPLSPELVAALGGSGRVLHGSGTFLLKVLHMPIPGFQEARELLEVAAEDITQALVETRAARRDVRVRNAFNHLFDASRLAAMCFLKTENSRRGEIRSKLPADLGDEFREFINTLHVAYYYDGKYPQGQEQAEFERWRQRVSHFIGRLGS